MVGRSNFQRFPSVLQELKVTSVRLFIAVEQFEGRRIIGPAQTLVDKGTSPGYCSASATL